MMEAAANEPTNREVFRKRLCEYNYRYHVHHPFDKLLQSGRASKEMLQLWAANRYYYQDTIPRKDATIIAKCPNSRVRAIWCKHIITHDVDGALNEWLQLTRSLGLPDEEVTRGSRLLPSTKFACDAYYNFCRDASWQDGICSSMTHLFAGDIHQMRIANWPSKYPWLPEEAFSYFNKRKDTLPEEIDATLELLSDHFCADSARLDRAVSILKFKQDVLWSMMDALWNYFFSPQCRMPAAPPSGRGKAPVLRILGSGAGGGLPQWNKTDDLNDRARHGCLVKRSQCSIAASADRKRWVLVNCSPDLRQQWNDLVHEYPDARFSGDVILTDCQLDHIVGLLSLRETKQELRIHSSQAVLDVLRMQTRFVEILQSYTHVKLCCLPQSPTLIQDLTVSHCLVESRCVKFSSEASDAIAVGINGVALYIPCVSPSALVPALAEQLRGFSTVLCDGTFATEDEMPSVHGHACIKLTSAFFEAFGLPPPVYLHINNSNPFNYDAGNLSLAHDGMEVGIERHTASSPSPRVRGT